MTKTEGGPSTPSIAVTGATGRLGSRVARLVAAAGRPQRLVVRRPPGDLELPGTEAVVVAGGYGDGDGARRALEGTSAVLMVSAAEAVDRVGQHRAFVDAAVAADVGHVVYTSFYGASPAAVFTLARDHWATEEYLRDSGMGWTFLRDNLYLDLLADMAGPDGVIRGPAGDGRFAGVAVDDIAAVAAAVIIDPAPHAGRVYDLTGPEELTMAEAAAIITASTGRDVSFQDETAEEAYASRSHYGAPDWQVDAWVSTYRAIAAGEMAGVTDVVERIVGRPPMALRDLLGAG
ncbi:MAG: NmrA family NAD(P)-binding protein [Acidimicrobiia bacterium]